MKIEALTKAAFAPFGERPSSTGSAMNNAYVGLISVQTAMSAPLATPPSSAGRSGRVTDNATTPLTITAAQPSGCAVL